MCSQAFIVSPCFNYSLCSLAKVQKLASIHLEISLPSKEMNCLTLLRLCLFILETRVGKDRFQIEVLTLVQNITENRLRHDRGPVHYIKSVTSIAQVSYTLTLANS